MITISYFNPNHYGIFWKSWFFDNDWKIESWGMFFVFQSDSVPVSGSSPESVGTFCKLGFVVISTVPFEMGKIIKSCCCWCCAGIGETANFNWFLIPNLPPFDLCKISGEMGELNNFHQREVKCTENIKQVFGYSPKLWFLDQAVIPLACLGGISSAPSGRCIAGEPWRRSTGGTGGTGGAGRCGALRSGEGEGYVSQLVQIGDKEREQNFFDS